MFGRRHVKCFSVLIPFWMMLSGMNVGCRTLSPIARFDLSQPAWTIKQGQAIWRPGSDKPEIAGELLLAFHPDGRTLVQFLKTPFPILVGRTTPTDWEIEFIPQQREIRGRGKPWDRFIWLHLGAVLFGQEQPPTNWSASVQPELQWEFKNQSTGEILKGYFDP